MLDSTTTLPPTIQQLLDRRNSHSKALGEIEATVTRVNAALANGTPAKAWRAALLPFASAKRQIGPRACRG